MFAKLWSQVKGIYIHSLGKNLIIGLFEAHDLTKGMDSAFNVDQVKMSSKNEDDFLENDLKPFTNDEDASMLPLAAEHKNCDVDIYRERGKILSK